jgi:hypothetical protein
MKKSLILGAVAAAALTCGTASFADSDGFSNRDRQMVYRHNARPPVVLAYPESYEQTGSIYGRRGGWRGRGDFEDRRYENYGDRGDGRY